MTGLLFGVLGFAIYGLAPTGRLFAIGIPIMSLWGMYGPAAQGLATRRVGHSRQGALQGALSSVQMTTGIIGPVLFSEVFARSIDPRSQWHLPGAPYLLSAALLAIALGVATRFAKPAPDDRNLAGGQGHAS
jgi:DHA1 family tetracycline resistance protein-like MFS transporter